MRQVWGVCIVQSKGVVPAMRERARGCSLPTRYPRRPCRRPAVVARGRMPADPLTKIEPAKGNLAVHDVLCRGTLSLIDEEGHLDDIPARNTKVQNPRGI